MYPDAHTHTKNLSTSCYILTKEELNSLETTSACSAGIHPWDLDSIDDPSILLSKVELLASKKQIIAVGETGIDRIKNTDIQYQIKIFKDHWLIAEKHQLPLVIHNVRASSDLIHFLKHHKSSTPWLIHDYSGNTNEANEFLKFHPNCYFSFSPRLLGSKKKMETMKSIPINRVLIESDDFDKKSFSELIEKSALEEGQLLINFNQVFYSKT
jgi:TatD DNase family protein